VTVSELRIGVSRSTLNVDVPLKVGSLVVLEVGKVAVVIQKLSLHPGRWGLAALLQEARASEVVLAAEAGASGVVSNNEEAMEAEVAVALVSKEAVGSEDKMGMELLPQMRQQVRVALAAVGFLEVVEEVTEGLPVHPIVTVQGVGMIRVVGVAHMMTEVAVVVGIVATNAMALLVVVLEATWSR
jgi:hypothetical protein